MKKRLIAGFLAASMLMSALSVNANTSDALSETQMLSSENVVTEVVTEKLDFEPVADVGTAPDPLTGFQLRKGAGFSITDEMGADGSTQSLKINGLQSGSMMGQYDLGKGYSIQTGKVFSVDIYDDTHSKRTAVIKLDGGSNSGSESHVIFFGIKDNKYKAYSQKADPSDPTKFVYTDLNLQMNRDSIAGWHNFTVDMTKQGEVVFYVDDKELGKITDLGEEYGEFKNISFISFWGTIDSPDVYIDNISISESAPVASDLMIDDEMDTFDWTYAETRQNPADYEYSVDDGQTWIDCSSKPVYVGNVDIAIGDLMLRAKSPDGSEYTYPVIESSEAFSYTINVNLTMERQEDIKYFSVQTKDAPSVSVSSDYSRSGLTGMKIVPTNSGNYPNQFQIGERFESLVTDKVVTMWYYDQMEQASDFKAITVVQEVGTNGTWSNYSAAVGVDANNSSTNYTIRPNWGSSMISSVERSEGWHSFQWDFTVDGKCSIYIDGVLSHTMESNGFNDMAIMNSWATPTTYTHYFDDISITDTKEDVKIVPVAPTNPQVSDENNTFAWDYVEGKTSISLYEYSIDNGETFMNCTSNPQAIEEKLLPAGTVMVRLKATETQEAGAVLRSTQRFTDPAELVIASLEKEIEFISFANPNDYTTVTWEELSNKLELAKTAVETEKGLQDALDALMIAKEALEFDMQPQEKYTFADKVIPVEPAFGTLNWNEDENISFITDMAYRLTPEIVGGNQIAQFKYTFPKTIEEKQIIFYFYDSNSGDFDISVGNSVTGDGVVISSKNLDGTTNRRYQFYDIKDGEMTNQSDPEIRRRSDLHKVEINLTNGALNLYMDSILLRTIPNVDSIDYIDYTLTKSGSDESDITYLSLDELEINDKNAVTEIILPEQTVEIGHRETYEINHVNNSYVKPYEYDTTDKFTYSVSDTSVALITKGGSIQPMKPGEITATVTSSNGVSKTINVIVKDFMVESVALSDSIITQEPNYVSEYTMEPNSIKVFNAIIEPENATNLTKTWTSSDKSIATVENGEVTSYGKEGTTTITVTTEDGNKTSSVEITVKEKEYDFGATVFVAMDGNDYTGDGTIEKPYASIERARDDLRSHSQIIDGGAVVYIREGVYSVQESIRLEIQDSGNEESPVKYSAYDDEEVKITGAVNLRPSDFELVADTETLEKIQNNADGKVYVADVSELLPEDMLKVLAKGYSGNVATAVRNAGFNPSSQYYFLTFEETAMTLARWPNEDEAISGYTSYPGFTKINALTNDGQVLRSWNTDQIGIPGYIPPEEQDLFDSFTFSSEALTERMKTWNGIPMDGTDIVDMDIWYEGHTGVDYTTQSSPIRDITDGTMTSHFAIQYDFKNADWSRIYVYNLLQELDIPGEWYLDQDTKQLYVYPPEGTDMTSDEYSISIATNANTLITLTNTKYITVENVTLANTLGNVFTISGGNNNKLSRSTVTNTSSRVGSVGDSSSEIAMYNGIEYCTIENVNGGFSVGGSSRFHTLEAGYNYAHGNTFTNYQTMTNGFNSAINLGGVGNYVSSNVISESPNNAIMWSGNDHVIEFNEIFNVDLETTDTSAIYTGRNVINRGTVIKNNYFHNIGKTMSSSSANSAIYIDDVAAGIEIYDNVFEDLHWGVFINGGQYNLVYNNEFRDVRYAVVANDWSYAWLSRWYQHGYGLLNTTIDWQSPDSPYAKYPYIQTVYEGGDMNDSIYNQVIDNVVTSKNGSFDWFHYMVREVQPNAANVIKDWFFEKNNLDLS